MFNHDDSVNDRGPDSKLHCADMQTRELWRKAYQGDEFSRPGCMFRGEIPTGKLHHVETTQLYALSCKTSTITLHSVRLENFNYAQKFTLKVGGVFNKFFMELILYKILAPIDAPLQNESNAHII